MPTIPAPSRLGLMTNLAGYERRLAQHDATFRSNVPQHATPGGQILAFGLVSAAGVVESGSMNFTVTHTSTGFYTVTWTAGGVPKEQANPPHADARWQRIILVAGGTRVAMRRRRRALILAALTRWQGYERRSRRRRWIGRPGSCRA